MMPLPKKTTPGGKPKTESQAQIKARIENDQVEVKSWADLHSRLSEMSDTAWIFRGVSSPDHYPIPSIGREKQYGPYKRAQEERLFSIFKDRAVAIAPNVGMNDWQLLAYAQHVGVPTRLLDWSVSPLIGAFFALSVDSKEDRLIYCMKYSSYIYEVDTKMLSPFENTKEGRFSPPLLFDRIRAQRGVFTIHPDPTKMFYPNKSKILRIPNRFVRDFRKRLFKYGIDYWHIFPDFTGLGKQLSWQFENKVGLGTIFMSKP
jgi:hypothetical protein